MPGAILTPGNPAKGNKMSQAPAHRVRVGTIVLIFVATTLAATTASAEVSPCNHGGLHFAGGHTSYLLHLFGSKATIEPDNPNICGQSDVSVAWSMVTAASSDVANASGWAQSGYGHFGVDAPYDHNGYKVFSQWVNWCKDDGSDCSAKPTTKFMPAPDGAETYSNLYRDADGHIHMYADGDELDETNFNPTNDHWDADWSAQFSGETHDLGSDMPGTEGDRVLFNHLQKSTSQTVDWADINGIDFVGTADRYHRQFTDDPSFQIWTKPLNSIS